MPYRAPSGGTSRDNSPGNEAGRRRPSSVVTHFPASTYDRAARATLGRRRRTRRPGMKSHPPERHASSRTRDSSRHLTDGQAGCPPPQSSQMTSNPRSGSAARATLGRRRRTRRPGMKSHQPERHASPRIRDSSRYLTDGQAGCPPPQSSQMTSNPRSGSAARATLGRRRRTRRPGMKSHQPECHAFSRIRDSSRYETDGQAGCPPPQSSQMISKPRPRSVARATPDRRGPEGRG